MSTREGVLEAEVRWEHQREVSSYYSSFVPFLRDVMVELGFNTTDIQEDIAGYMAYGPQYLMVQAQRSQAKTSIAAAYAVYCLIHSPAHRVMVVSAGGDLANQISTLIVRIIMSMDVLEYMRPDKMAGDRTSVEAFDVHHSLKGIDKSPSVACFGIDSNLPGNRADLLMADDIESGKNSATAAQRAKLLQMTKEFTSINATGRILWLGTPQSRDSIYNSLPSRGVEVRIWPGRYPTPKQMEYYGTRLAPLIRARIQQHPEYQTGGGYLGNQGQPIDPVLLGEQDLQKKELDKGEADFQLQHMLCTAMADSMRFPIKLDRMILLRGDGMSGPIAITRGLLDTHLVDKRVCEFPFKLAVPSYCSPEMLRFASKWAYIDPAAGGANGDETAYAIMGFLSGNLYLLSVGGIPGGYSEDKMTWLGKHFAKFKVDGITIEKNMGFGAFAEIFRPVLRKYLQCQLDEEMVSGQKEVRIINILAPIVGRGSLIIDEACIEEDADRCADYSPGLRQSYSFFFQAAKLTSTRNSLLHDDRLDAVTGCANHFVSSLGNDQERDLEKARVATFKAMTADPLGHGRYELPAKYSNTGFRSARGYNPLR